MSSDAPQTEKPKKRRSPVAQIFLKGLAISLPSILTLVILVWIGRGIHDYVIHPINFAVRYPIAQFTKKTRPTDELVYWSRLPSLEFCDRRYRITSGLKNELTARLRTNGPAIPPGGPVPVEWLDPRMEDVYVPFGDESVPYRDYREIAVRVPASQMPPSAIDVYMELVSVRRYSQIPFSVFVLAIVLLLVYFLGRFVTVRLGAWAVNKFEVGVLRRVPIISNVYGSVKQVTDFFLTERNVEYNRVVALEYPRRGVWSLGFVTSDSLLEITAAAGEPLLAVLMPTSPMPMTGFTISVPRSEVLDLNITVDQAFQFCLSCGVLVPAQQAITPELLQRELAKRFSENSHALAKRRELPAAFHPERPLPLQEPIAEAPPASESAGEPPSEEPS